MKADTNILVHTRSVLVYRKIACFKFSAMAN